MGRNLSPRCGQVILVSGYPVIDHNIGVQCLCNITSCAPKLAWFPCGADGRAVYGHVITKFSGMGRFT